MWVTCQLCKSGDQKESKCGMSWKFVFHPFSLRGVIWIPSWETLSLCVSLFPLPGLLSVGLIEQLYLLTIPRALLRLPPAVLPVSLHSVRYSDIDGLRLRVASAGDEQGVGGRLAQVAGHEAVLPPRVAQRRRAGVCGGLADVGDDGDAVHRLLIITDLQNLQVDLDVGVRHTRHPHSDLHAHSHAADVHVSGLASWCWVVCAGLVADWFGAIHFNLWSRGSFS